MTPQNRRLLIAGNWKMNGTRAGGLALAESIKSLMRAEPDPDFDLLLCPPFTLIGEVGKIISGSGVALGAQDCHHQASGAHTGDISAAMLADLGCSYVIVGHSERRAKHGETNGTVKAKAQAALDSSLIPIICTGETEAEKDAGQTLKVIDAQLEGSLPAGSPSASIVIAYEPVWAIGAGRTPSSGEVEQVHAFIRHWLLDNSGEDAAQATRILYGGSMNERNARDLLALPGVDGGLIGGASLKAESFLAIAKSCP